MTDTTVSQSPPDFSRETLRHNLKRILSDNRDVNPETMLDRVMSAIPRIAIPTEQAAQSDAVREALDAQGFAGQQAAHWLPDMETRSLDARLASLLAMARNCITHGYEIALAATPPAPVEPEAMTLLRKARELLRRGTAGDGTLEEQIDAFLVKVAALRATASPAGRLSPPDVGDERLITLWRKTGDKLLEWDHYVSENADEACRSVENLKKQGVRQWSTYRLGAIVPVLSDVTGYPSIEDETCG